MLEGILSKILANYFGKYFSGLDKENLNISTWYMLLAIDNFIGKGILSLKI